MLDKIVLPDTFRLLLNVVIPVILVFPPTDNFLDIHASLPTYILLPKLPLPKTLKSLFIKLTLAFNL